MELTRVIGRIAKELATHKTNKKLVLPEGWDERIVKAARIIRKENYADLIILVRDEKEIDKGLQLDKNVQYIIVNEEDTLLKKELAKKLTVLNKKYETTMRGALDILTKPCNFGAMLLNEGIADAFLGGVYYTTKAILLAAFRIVRTKIPHGRVGDFFLMEKNNESYIFVNCAINMRPTPHELVDLAASVLPFARRIGYEVPKVAFLSYSTDGSAAGESAERIRQAAFIAQKDSRFSNASVAPELQFDAAMIPEIRKKKAPEVNWEGTANIFVFPTLNSGNVGYKIAQRFGGMVATGPILTGISKPINDLSRGATLQDIVSSAILTLSLIEDKKEN